MTPSPAPRGELTPEISDAIEELVASAKGVVWDKPDRGARTASLREADLVAARKALESAILALSGPPSGQESRDTVLLDAIDRVDEDFRGYGMLLTGRIKDWLRDLARETPSRESRAGGAAPQEPDWKKAREIVREFEEDYSAFVDGEERNDALADCAQLRTTLDQAESEIARLRALLNPPLSSGTYPYPSPPKEG